MGQIRTTKHNAGAGGLFNSKINAVGLWLVIFAISAYAVYDSSEYVATSRYLASISSTESESSSDAASDGETTNHIRGSSSAVANRDVACYEQYLPDWVRGDPESMANEFKIGSDELSDKYDDGHRFFYAYQPYLAKIVLQKLKSSYGTNTAVCNNSNDPNVPKPKLKFLEIGLGCHFKVGGMKRGTPGGSALGWYNIFKKLHPVLDVEIHIMEYDSKCATEWHEKDNHKEMVHIHTGDASSEVDLARIVNETGSSLDFDVIIDDASHINWHMIKTLEVMIEQVQLGGIYVVEDVWSSCRNWGANMGSKQGEGTGGSRGCMTTGDGKSPTFFAQMVEYQKLLLQKKLAFPQVNHIDFHGQIVVFEKQLPQATNKWITKSS